MVTILLVPFRVLFTYTKDAGFLDVCSAKRKGLNKHRRWHLILRAKSGTLYIVQQKLMICCPSRNQCQFFPVSTARRVSQVADGADGLRTDTEGNCQYIWYAVAGKTTRGCLLAWWSCEELTTINRTRIPRYELLHRTSDWLGFSETT
jgi:hypothetical protein